MANDLIEEFGEIITVIRSSPQGVSTADGSVTPGPTVTFQCFASIQPISGNELVAIPELERQKGWFWAYCELQLNTSTTYPNVPADILIDALGTQYRVMGCQPWRSDIISIAPYWRGKLCLVNP